jgi:hypothetical protein
MQQITTNLVNYKKLDLFSQSVCGAETEGQFNTPPKHVVSAECLPK